MKEDTKIGFVILHYIVIDETINCVNSIIKNCQDHQISIIIVDNASPNGSGKQLEETYRSYSYVHVILNETNEGFAKGNNKGFSYAKYNEKCDYICMLNNDTLITQPDFIDLFLEDFQKYSYAVLGPKIINADGKTIALFPRITSVSHMRNFLFCLKLELLLCKFIPFFYLVFELMNKIKLKKSDTTTAECFHTDLILHGCCWIFSPTYINQFNGIDDRTFLYGEERLLFVRLKKNNLKSCYDPRICIKHLEDVSTNALLKNSRQKRIKKLTYGIQSMKLLIEELKGIPL